jgi:hypothetical protein
MCRNLWEFRLGAVMKSLTVLLAAACLAGCAVDPRALTGASAGATTILSFYSTSADLRQQLALDTIKESAQLEYLSNYERTCRDNPGYMFPKDYRSARNIKAEALKKFEESDVDYKFLVEYSRAFDKIVKQAGDVAADIENAVAIAKTAGKFSSETAAMSEIAALLGQAAIAVNEEVKFQKIKRAARRYQKLLEEHAKTLSGRLSGLDRQTMRDIAVWRDCVQEKFKVIGQIARPSVLPTSAIELDSAYGVFQAQYRSYVGSSPQAGDMLQALVDANKEISKAPSSALLRESLERYVQIFESSRAVIAKAGALQD